MMATMNDNGQNGRSLPDGWEFSTLGEIADLIGGGTPSRENPEYFTGDIVWLTPTEIPKTKISVVSDSREKITQDGLRKSSARLIPKGSVLMTSRASIGYVAIAGTEVTTNQGFSSFIPKQGINNFYLAYWLWANANFFIEQATGTTFKEITKSKLRNFSLPIPPLPEQERIVNRIEELLSDLDAGVAALERVRAGLKRYKASVLKVAVEGKLFENRESDELPDGWRWARAADICGFITKGTTPKPSKLFAGGGDVPFIKVYNLTFDGSLDFSINPTFVSAETHTGELARSKILPGDVLMNIVGPPLGKVSIVPDTFPEWNMNQAVARFRPLEICDKKYLSIALKTESVLSWAVKRAKATAGQFNLTLEICRDLPIPLPPLEEQRRIVAEVERRLSVVGEVESAVEVGLVRAGRLRQSVLRSAFEGRL